MSEADEWRLISLVVDAAMGRPTPLQQFIRQLRIALNFRPVTRPPKEPIFDDTYRLGHAAQRMQIST
jgi:hypothetical protein